MISTLGLDITSTIIFKLLKMHIVKTKQCSEVKRYIRSKALREGNYLRQL